VISQVIGRLKQRFPQKVDLYRVTSRSTNVETGVESETKEVFRIRQAIVLPPTLGLDPSKALAAISGANFSFGGLIEANTVVVLIDARDIPKNINLNVEDFYAIINKMRYEVVKVNTYGVREAFILNLKGLPGIKLEQIIDREFVDTLVFVEEASHE
jgi:hypothetical protein